VILGVHQDVPRSEVAVHDSVFVGRFEGLADRYDYSYGRLAGADRPFPRAWGQVLGPSDWPKGDDLWITK
jgi:hypothetical protein